MRPAQRTAVGLLVVLALAFVALATWEPFAARRSFPPPARAYTAEIVRDEFGVPHIYGRTDADVAYGVAQAHAADDFTTLQDVIAMSKGRYGAIRGAEGAQVDYMYHLLGARATAERRYPLISADTRALFEAYAAGLNDFAAKHPGEVKLARLFPVNGLDVAAGFALRQPFFFGLADVIGPLVEGKPLRPEAGPPIPGSAPAAPAPAATVEPARRIAAAMPLPWGETGSMSGSNAFVVAPKASGGPSVLVSNSHQPWKGGVAWYELVVESGEGWHFAGANFPGSPYPFLGHNRHLGWTNTVNRPDMIDVYKLVLDESGTKYRIGGTWVPLEQRTVTLPVRIGPVVLPVRRTVWRSAHGPVIKNEQGAFAVRYGGIDRLDQLDAYYRLNKAKSFAEWEAQIARMAIPSTNFLYADETGTIAYVYNAAIPQRTPGPNWRGVLPGDDPALIWTGPVPYAALPKYVNPPSGWLFNANNTPFSAAGRGSDLASTVVPPEMGVELGMTNRARRSWRLLSEATRGGGKLDRATLEAIKFDTGYDAAGHVAEMLRAVRAVDPRGDKRLAEARALVLGWDRYADNIGRGDALALMLNREYMSSSYQGKPWPDAEKELTKAKDHLLRHFGRLDPPMSELLRLRRGPGPNSVDLPLDGGSDTLRASTLWDVAEDGRLIVKHGDSFVMWAEWYPGQRVQSRSIQPFGSATTRPSSPHYTDQSTLFVQHRMKPVRFWRDDVMANARSRKVVRHRPER
ncbi:acylase [Qipengyuania sediminis]|uniref:acylase n=1 Tax=Qipengyuania sediminis TaxID=1532023 RepID=UPI00105A349B|nr:acylase [Qipengyuania sediminis]